MVFLVGRYLVCFSCIVFLVGRFFFNEEFFLVGRCWLYGVHNLRDRHFPVVTPIQ